MPARKAFVRKRPDADKAAPGGPRLKGRATGPAREKDAAESAEASAAAGKKKLILISVGAVVLLGALVLAWQFYPGTSTPSKTGRGDSKVAAKTPAAKPAAVKTEGDEKAAAGAEPLVSGESPTPEVESLQGPIDPLAVLPGDVNLVARLQIGQLVNLLDIREDLQNHLKSHPEAAPFLEETGFDPLTVGSVWVGARLALENPPNVENAEWIAVLEGAFENEKMTSGLKKLAMVAEKESVQGKLKVLDCLNDGKHFAFLTFPAPGQAILGTDALFGEAVKLLGAPPSDPGDSTGKPAAGGSVRGNKKLSEISGSFTPKGAIWVAGEFPETPKKPQETGAKASGKGAPKAAPGEGAPEGGEAPPPMPSMPGMVMPLGGVLSLDGALDGPGLLLEAQAIYPSPDEMKKAQSILGPMLLATKKSAPPDLASLLDAIKMKPSGRKILFTAKIPPEALAMLKSQLKAGAPPGPEGGEDAAGDGSSDAGLPEGGAEPAPAGSADEKPDAEPVPDPGTNPDSDPGDAGGSPEPDSPEK